MTRARIPSSIWLVLNEASGSNDRAMEERLLNAFGDAGITVARKIRFPTEPLPTGDALNDAGIDTLGVFTGDGTLNSTVGALRNWDGTLLPLPGGTMNLFCRKLHGEIAPDDIVARLADGRGCIVHPPTIEGSNWFALAGLLIGPGTSWNRVREAMRHFDLPGILGGVGEAVSTSLTGVPVIMHDPAVGDREGYPLIELAPTTAGIEIATYHAKDAQEFAATSLALMTRNFREGPHDDLGPFASITIASAEDEPLSMLFDGEPATGGTRERFALVQSPIGMIATGA